MTEAAEFRRKADEMLKLAAQAGNMAERGRLIDEATRWHMRALDLEAGGELQGSDEQATG